MWKSQRQVEGREIIDDGVILSYSNESVEITIEADVPNEDDDESSLTFVIEFRDTGDDPGLETSILEDDEMKLTFLNHRKGASVGGTTSLIGSAKPIDIAVIGERELYLGYTVNSIRSEEQTPVVTQFYYNIYLEREVDEPEG